MDKEAIRNAITVLSAAKAEVAEHLAETPNLLTRTNSVLQSLITGMSYTIGDSTPEDKSTKFSPKPLRSVAGQKITVVQKKAVSAALPRKDEIKELQKRAEEAYTNFIERDAKDIREALTDREIRAVAKLAGMEVSSTIPEFIDLPFIESIKEAIHVNEELKTTQKNGKDAKEKAKKEQAKKDEE